jgi:hypothetical protein
MRKEPSSQSPGTMDCARRFRVVAESVRICLKSKEIIGREHWKERIDRHRGVISKAWECNSSRSKKKKERSALEGLNCILCILIWL